MYFLDKGNMKYLENLTTLLGRPVSPRDFELHHQLKLLKIEIAKVQSEVRTRKNETLLTEALLNSTIQDLRVSNLKIRKLKREQLEAQAKELQFREKQLEQITGSMTSSMCYIDSNYVYRYVNHKYEEWFGISAETMIGKSVEELSPGLFQMNKSIYDSVMEGNEYEKEIDMLAPNGKRFVFSATYVPAQDLDNNNIGIYIYGTNVTENKLKTEAVEKTEREISKKNTQLKQYIQSNVQLEQFAHIAAHDMMAPLRTISSFTGILENKIKDLLGEKEKEYFGFIKEGTQSLSHLISDLLNYSKVKSQGIILTEVDLPDLISKVLRYLKESIEEKEATIEIGDMPDTIVADRTKLYQVLQNLIGNAMKFTAPGATPIVKLEAQQFEDKIKFSVSDNGIGISPSEREGIFDPFKQLNTKQKFKGAGLGLAICKRIVEDHKGEIKALQSDLGGSKFEFSLSKNLK